MFKTEIYIMLQDASLSKLLNNVCKFRQGFFFKLMLEVSGNRIGEYQVQEIKRHIVQKQVKLSLEENRQEVVEKNTN